MPISPTTTSTTSSAWYVSATCVAVSRLPFLVAWSAI